MDDKLLEIMLGRLEKYPLADEAADLLLAAFESEDSLLAQLSGEAAGRRQVFFTFKGGQQQISCVLCQRRLP